MATKILRNRAQCKICEDILESKYPSDFVTCKCGGLSVDGGSEYLRRTYDSPYNFIELSEMVSTDIIKGTGIK